MTRISVLSISALLKPVGRDYLLVTGHDRPCTEKETTQMGIRTTIKKWAAYQQTVRELTALDSRQLSDLGINRADIQRVARDHARTI